MRITIVGRDASSRASVARAMTRAGVSLRPSPSMARGYGFDTYTAERWTPRVDTARGCPAIRVVMSNDDAAIVAPGVVDVMDAAYVTRICDALVCHAKLRTMAPDGEMIPDRAAIGRALGWATSARVSTALERLGAMGMLRSHGRCPSPPRAIMWSLIPDPHASGGHR